MKIVQTFRRLGQQMSRWGNAFDMQSAQMPLIKKLYAKNGLEIKGGGACPEQYDVFKDGQQVAYYRLRHGEFTVNLGLPCFADSYSPSNSAQAIISNASISSLLSEEKILSECPNGDGIFDNNERLLYLSKAMHQVLLKLKIRESSLQWWNNLTVKLKKDYVDIHFFGRTFASITGREIEQIYLSEHSEERDIERNKI